HPNRSPDRDPIGESPRHHLEILLAVEAVIHRMRSYALAGVRHSLDRLLSWHGADRHDQVLSFRPAGNAYLVDRQFLSDALQMANLGPLGAGFVDESQERRHFLAFGGIWNDQRQLQIEIGNGRQLLPFYQSKCRPDLPDIEG